MFKYSNLQEGQVVDLKNEIALVSPVDTPLVTLLYQRGRVVPAYDITVTWMEKALAEGSVRTNEEGMEAGKYANSTLELKENICQILETGTKVSGTVQALNPKGIEDVYVSEINDRMAELKMEQERCFLNGKKDTSATRKMAGLMSMALQKEVDGVLTEDHIIDAMELMFNAGCHGDVYLFCGAKVKRMINNFVKQENSALYQIQAGQNAYGFQVQVIATDFGNVNIVIDRHMKGDEILIVDIDQVEIAELRPAFYEALPKNGDYFHGHIISENTIKLLNHNSAVALTGIADAQSAVTLDSKKSKK